MTRHNRRTILKASGTALLGAPLAGTASGRAPTNESVDLLEARVEFDFSGLTHVRDVHSDRPVKYALDTDDGVLEPRAVTDAEENLLAESDRIVHFLGLEKGDGPIGGTRITALPGKPDSEPLGYTYVQSSGYELPEIDVNWTPQAPSDLLSAPDVSFADAGVADVDNGVRAFQLPAQSVDVPTVEVSDELVETGAVPDDLPDWKRARKKRRVTEVVTVSPVLKVAFHPNIDVVERAPSG